MTNVLSPVELASSAGFRRSGWLKVGDGPWRGQVTDVCADGTELELEIEQLASSWRCVTDGTSAKTLELLLKQLQAKKTRKKT